MPSLDDDPFSLPDHLAAKATPALIGPDRAHLAAVAATVDDTVRDLEERLAVERRAPAGHGTAALERDQEVQRLSSRLRTLRRFGLDLCLGRMVPADGGEPVYVGRLGLADRAGRRLLVDWRSPAAEPFFAASHGDPRGLLSRRRYRWTGGRVTDYWDEVFTVDGLEDHAALDDQSAFLASLGERRTAQMRDVLATIQADQDAVIRAGSRGTLVVDGGPGTGKTVVALHRAAYLLYADARLRARGGGVLFVGPHRPYLRYVADVLPSLGEDGVRTCTLRDLLPEGADAPDEADPAVAALKRRAGLVRAVEPAVRLYEEPPSGALEVPTPWGEVRVGPEEWREAFDSAPAGTPHNEARDRVWDELLTILTDAFEVDDEDVTDEMVRRALARDEELAAAFDRAWIIVEPTDLVADLWSVPAYLRRCAPWLTPDEVRLLQREDAQAWTTEDLPLLDAARLRLGDPTASRRARRERAEREAERAEMDAVVEHLIATDDSDLMIMSMLRGDDLRGALVQDGEAPDPHSLAGPFAHVVVDEAQELSDAEWQMLLARCPSRSFTVVGDRAQARHGFPETWEERLGRVGLVEVTRAGLSVNYRTPEEVMAEAEPVIRAALPDANVPTSVRRSGIPVRHGALSELDDLLATWLREHPDGTGCVIGLASYPDGERVRSLTPVLSKGLEFDLVLLVDPDWWGDGVEGAVDRYVAMTRATSQLVVLTR
ncbi:AAA family ATPase [Nocardioides anomalus]|uniref:AAA family ATPase n=1 Tax=Nocardioides anomalus TaxID=2712223 RepID=A0A6G6WJD1_9ACTN|nr:RNA polymerase recycling motor ATPase HelR [Nocardioides anomalus]QIG45441.1 AAA family ATPase [Nocardioides anomalus]